MNISLFIPEPHARAASRAVVEAVEQLGFAWDHEESGVGAPNRNGECWVRIKVKAKEEKT